jgi:hypothetical protein
MTQRACAKKEEVGQVEHSACGAVVVRSDGEHGQEERGRHGEVRQAR